MVSARGGIKGQLVSEVALVLAVASSGASCRKQHMLLLAKVEDEPHIEALVLEAWMLSAVVLDDFRPECYMM